MQKPLLARCYYIASYGCTCLLLTDGRDTGNDVAAAFVGSSSSSSSVVAVIAAAVTAAAAAA